MKKQQLNYFVWIALALSPVLGAWLLNLPEKRASVVNMDMAADTLAKNLIVPWEMQFLDPNSLLFTERNGKLRMMKDGQLQDKPVFEVDEIETEKKMGLLGFVLHPDFKNNHWIYLASNYRSNGRAFLHVVRYEWREGEFLNAKTIIDYINASPNHTGCRLIFSRDKKLFITSGDADKPIDAQDLKSLNGKILRLNDDGSVPDDNPFFLTDTARAEIWSYGHRNPQGLAFMPGTNELYESEHGPTGGDEINLIEKGKNYGWPVIHHKEEKRGMVSPLMEFTPSVGPSDLLFYQGNAFPDLKGKLLMATLRGEAIWAFSIKKKQITDQQLLFKDRFRRVRSIVEAPDGSIWFSTSQVDPPEARGGSPYDMIFRLHPGNEFSDKGVSLEDRKAINSIRSANNAAKSTAMLYEELCASCHGSNLEGTERAASMLDDNWQFGGSAEAIKSSIWNGIIEKGMPAWQGALTEKETISLVEYILQRNKQKSEAGLP